MYYFYKTNRTTTKKKKKSFFSFFSKYKILKARFILVQAIPLQLNGVTSRINLILQFLFQVLELHKNSREKKNTVETN